MASILFLVNHPEAYINHRNYFEEKGFEVTMRHIWEFRSDLYYRISHVRFNVPPVRDYYNIPGLMEFLIYQVCEEYNLTPYIDKHDLVIETMQKLHPYKGNIREIKSYLTTELIKLDASRSSTLTGIELMKTTPL